LAKVLIMLVRVVALVSIVLGVLLWSGSQNYLGPHIGSGFLISAVVFALSIFGILKKAVVPGILGVILAVLLPVVGLKQLPLTYHTFGIIQIIHVLVALAIIGVAESLYGAIRRAS